jgi:opacity protein-like surface antigen
MKKIILSSLIALATVSAANAGAYVSGYLNTYTDSEEVNVGVTGPSEVSFLNELGLDLTVGYAFSNGLRLEADIVSATLYKDNNADFIDNLDFRISVTQVKALYDFKVGGKFTPYVGVGIFPFGAPNGQGGLGYEADGSLTVVGSGVVGVLFALDSKVALDLQYSRTLAYNSNATGDATYNGTNLFKLGVKYNF